MSTSIQWTDEVWNFVTGCDPVSPGCFRCYAAQLAVMRGKNPMPVMQQKYAGIAEMRGLPPHRHAVFNGTVRFHEPSLTKPLGWKRPRRVFVNSMSDLFHPGVSDEVVDRAVAIMAICPQHTFQVLTKRPERQAAYFTRLAERIRTDVDAAEFMLANLPNGRMVTVAEYRRILAPLPNLWLGTSVEDQQRADERIPHLLRTPAAVRFLSCEPLLEPLDLDPFLPGMWECLACGAMLRNRAAACDEGEADPLCSRCGSMRVRMRHLHWIIVGGESGAGARPFDLEWARSVVAQCRAAGVAPFVKQLGSAPVSILDRITHRRNPVAMPQGFSRVLNDGQGGDMEEWPEDLRVREFPARVVAHA